MPADTLPHAYPFRIVDTVLSRPDPPGSRGRVSMRVSSNARLSMGEGWHSPLLYVEAIAQAALLLAGGDPERGRRGFLAGIDGFTFTRLPAAGDTLEVDVTLTGRFGPAAKFEGEVVSGGETVAKAGVFVRQET
jgi:3-hydroxymyristoyl/3-hydroxydecanoyl-(acyl carrier protein) dehydratase